MSATWDIFVLEYARSHQQPWVDLIAGMAHAGAVDLPFSFILAVQGQRKVLIDTGFMQEEASSGFARKFGIPNWISPVRMVAEMGIAADEITDIIVTHAHFDHMGSIAEFPKAQIHIQKSELLTWYEAIALPKRFSHLTAIIDPENLRACLKASIESTRTSTWLPSALLASAVQVPSLKTTSLISVKPLLASKVRTSTSVMPVAACVDSGGVATGVVWASASGMLPAIPIASAALKIRVFMVDSFRG